MLSLEESTDENIDARKMASMLGVRLVTQVLDEACTIVNTAQKIGCFKDHIAKNNRFCISGHTDLLEILQGDNEIINENKENASHITTSTPQKDVILKLKPDNSFIGQGDEEIDMVSKEGVAHHDEEEIKQEIEEIIIDNEAQTFSSYIMFAIMEKLYKTTFGTATENEDVETGKKDRLKSPEDFLEKLRIHQTTVAETSESKVVEIDEDDDNQTDANEYCYSLLKNAYEGDSVNDIAFYIDDDGTSANEFDQIKVVVKAEIHAEIEENVEASVKELSDEEADRADRLEAARYENAYLSLNRDYEQCSEDDGDPILQDPKSPMQEVELFAASTEDDDDDNSSYREQEEERKGLAATSAISGASGSRKSRTSLVSRCRSQGARLLSCLRGWWRRKTPGKRKGCRASGSVHGVCPLSPGARCRAASLLAQRHLSSPAPSRSVVWKFNTVNEAVINSSKWKEYTFEVNPEACGEHC